MEAAYIQSCRSGLLELINESIEKSKSCTEVFSLINKKYKKNSEPLESFQEKLTYEKNKIIGISNNLKTLKGLHNKIERNDNSKTIFIKEWIKYYSNERNYKESLKASHKNIKKYKSELINFNLEAKEEEKEFCRLKNDNNELETVLINMEKLKSELETKCLEYQDLIFEDYIPIAKNKGLYYPERNEGIRLMPNLRSIEIYNHNINPSIAFKITKYLNCELPNDCAIAITNTSVFISGGFNESYKEISIFSYTFQIEANGNLMIKNNMLTPRYKHSFISVDDNTLYAIAGCVDDGITNSCEMYSINKDVWTSIPSLNKKRCCPGLCQFNQKILYAFYGFDNRKYATIESTIEKFEIAYINSSWIILNVKVMKEICNFGVMQISNHEILLFGGALVNYKTSISHLQLLKDCYILDIEKDKLSEISIKISCPDEFVGVQPIYCDGLMIALGRTGCVHLYDISGNRWNRNVFYPNKR